MQRLRRIALLALAASLLGLSPIAAQDFPETAVGPVNTPSIQAPLSAQDVEFLRRAAEMNMAQIMAGQVAMQRGAIELVRQFGARQAVDHTNIESLMMRISTRKRVALPLQPDDLRKAEIFKLGNLSGKTFDEAYADFLVREHKELLSMYEKQMKDGKDEGLCAIARRVLPRLRAHLTAAEQLRDAIKAKTYESSGS